MYTANRDYVKKKYKLEKLRDVENLIADAVSVQVPFNNYITGYCAFTHKAGIHAKAILNNPSTYEILKPEDFGMTRYVSIGHRLTGKKVPKIGGGVESGIIFLVVILVILVIVLYRVASHRIASHRY